MLYHPCIPAYQSGTQLIISIKYNTGCMHTSLLRTTGLGCGKITPLSFPCAPESIVKTRISLGVYIYSSKLMKEMCSFTHRQCNAMYIHFFSKVIV